MSAVAQLQLMLTLSRVSDLQFQSQLITQAKLNMQNTVGTLFTLSSNLEPNSPYMQALNARLMYFQQVEKAMDLQLQRIQTQLQAMQTMQEGLRKVLTENIKATFSKIGVG
ncbi:MAG: hypothetical protein ACKO34_02235 [Vampirovibrionales bacterium]